MGKRGVVRCSYRAKAQCMQVAPSCWFDAAELSVVQPGGLQPQQCAHRITFNSSTVTGLAAQPCNSRKTAHTRMSVRRCLPACSGFYIDKTITDWGGSGQPRIMLVTQVARERAGETQSFQVRRPNNGFDRHRRSLRDVSARAGGAQGLVCATAHAAMLRRGVVVRMPSDREVWQLAPLKGVVYPGPDEKMKKVAFSLHFLPFQSLNKGRTDAAACCLQIQDYWKPIKNLQRAEAIWTHWFDWADEHCMHGPNCAARKRGEHCRWGGRHTEVQMISGAVLPIWKVRVCAAAESASERGAWDSAGQECARWCVHGASSRKGAALVQAQHHVGACAQDS